MTDPAAIAEGATTAADPIDAYASALAQYEPTRLVRILQAIDPAEKPPTRGAAMAEAVADRLSASRVAEGLIAGLGHVPRMALGLYAMTETTAWPALGLARA